MNVLSLFDGMSCGRIALERAGIEVTNYYASEIDKYAITVSRDNWFDITHIGDVTKVSFKNGWLYTEKGNFYVGKIDLLIGGSPCQDLRPGRDGLKGAKSKLFYEYERIKKECDPRYYLLENVFLISKDDKQIITDLLGNEPVLINSSLVSAQTRKRYYWTNIPFLGQPADRNIFLKDITLNGESLILRWQNSGTGPVFDVKAPTLKALSGRGGVRQQPLVLIEDLFLTKEEINKAQISYRSRIWKSGNRMGSMAFPDRIDKKSKAVCATMIKANHQTIHIKEGENVRILHPIEYERLQTVPDNYTSAAINGARYRMLGNGWTVDVIAHLFKPLKDADIL